MPTNSPVLLGNKLPYNLPEPQKVDNNSWTQVSAFNDFTVGLRSNSILYAWGTNNSYQIGDGTTLNKSTPTQISNSSFLVVSAGFDHSAAITTNNTLFVWGNSASTFVQTINFSWTKVASSGNHTLAIRNDNTLWTWGLNTAGQLGDGTTINKSSPVQIGSGTWNDISAAVSHSVAIDSDYKLYVWGQNNAGQIGDNTSINKSSPVQIGSNSWLQVASGNSYTVSINSLNEMFAWGLNTSYQLGDRTVINKSSPVQIGSTFSWSSVSAGVDHSLAITTDNQLYIWGNPAGAGIQEPTTIYSWTQVTAGNIYTTAIRSDGSLWTWGRNTEGQLGQNNVILQSSPVQVGNSSYTQVSGKWSHTSAIKADSTIIGYGSNTYGELGDGTTIAKSNPVTLSSSFTNTSWTSVSASVNHTAAIRNDGRIYIWGLNTSGQLGDNTAISKSNPVSLASPFDTSSWTQVDLGRDFALARRLDGKLYAWGFNDLGQLGIVNSTFPIGGDTLNRSNPVLISDSSWIQVSAGFDHSLAIRSDNTLWTWGSSVAIGLVTEPMSWLAVSGGATHTLGIRDNGTLWTWGTNDQGQLGNSTTVIRLSPVQIGLTRWASVSAGSSYSHAIDQAGLLYAWGLNSSGQLGDNSSINKSSPVQIGSSSWIEVTDGVNHTLAIDADGRLYGWGQFTSGQTGVYDEIYSWTQITSGLGLRTDGTLWAWGQLTGDGTTIIRSSPVQIGSSDWSSIAPIFSMIDPKAALKTNGTLWMWGTNALGQLGQNDTINRSSPVQVAGSWNQISVQSGHAAARNVSNIIYTWGKNEAGQLGDGTTIDKSSPVLLSGAFGTTSWTSVSVGWSHTAALRNDNIIYIWGWNNQGQLGTGLTTSRSNPVTLDGAFATSSFVAVSSGALHTLAVRSDSRLVAWGYNLEGSLGDNTTINKSTPVVIGTSSWSVVTAARTNNLAVTTTGTLWFWGADGGSGSSAQNATINRSAPTQIGALTNWASAGVVSAINNLGVAFVWGSGGSANTSNTYLLNTTVDASSPVQVGGFRWPPTKYYSPQQVGTSSFSLVSAGSSYSMGINAEDLLYGWGVNNSGQQADGTTVAKSSPVQITTSSYISVSAGFDHVLAIASNGTLWTWGNSAAIGLVVQPQSWSEISSGSSHTLAIRSDGALFAWGIGTSGQLGNTLAISNSSPVQVGTSSWSQVKAGTNVSLAIDTNNRLFGWGLNTSAQLGIGVITNRSSPVLITSGSWIGLAAGGTHTFAIDSTNKLYGWGNNDSGQIIPYGSYFPTGYSPVSAGGGFFAAIRTSDSGLLLWGRNNFGQLGQGNTIDRSNPIQLGSNSWKQVAAGTSFISAIRSDDTLWTWGLNTSGQLGDNTSISKSSPVQVAGSWLSISGGATHALGVKIDNTLWSWGSNDVGQLGDSTVVNKSSPVQIGTRSWSSVNAGNSYSLAIDTTGIVYGWGWNTSGQLGDGTTTNRNSPVLLASPFNTTSFSQVTAGFSHSLGFTTSGLLYSWGGNSVGELGLGLITSRSNPTQITQYSGLLPQNGSWSFIYAGQQISTAINNNNLYVWGSGASGQLGLGDTINRSIPVQTGIGYSWKAAALEVATNLGAGYLRSDNSVWVTGNNTFGNLGNSTTVNRSAPVIVGSTSISTPVQVGTSSWSQISAGASYSAGIDSLGKLYTWGLNNTYQLGNNTTVDRNDVINQLTNSSWTSVSTGLNHVLAIASNNSLHAWGSAAAVGLSNVTALSWSTIASGGQSSHLAAIRSDGALFTWGLNTNGQLGDGTTINKSSPTQISGTISWTSVAVDLSNTMAIRLGGTLFVWGGNASGQLGLSDTINRSNPVLLDYNSWSQISVNTSHTAGIRSNQLYVWGNNVSGQIGDNTTINKSSPVQVTGSWNSVSAGAQYTIGINNSSLLFVWGVNAAFQLGTGNTVSRSSPVQIATGTSYSIISAGPTHAVAIDTTSKLWTWGQQSSVGIDVNSWTQVSIGNQFVLAIRNDGRLFAWGVNSSGQLGLGDTILRSSPVLVGNNSWSAISAAIGGNNSAGIASDGKLFTWGNNNTGQLGDGTTINKSSPVQISSGSSFSLVAAGPGFLLAASTNYALFTSGGNSVGQLGDGTTINKSTPVQITDPSVQSWIFISAGTSYSGGIDNLGKLYTWGTNFLGILGHGDTINRSKPTIVSGSTSWSKVSAGGVNTLGITNLGALYAWGQNNVGQIGDGTTINKSSPVQIGSSSWSAVAASDSVSMAIRSDNTLWTWGHNSVGQLGIGLTTNRSSPVQVVAGAQWSSIASSGNNTMVAISIATGTSNKLYLWGFNASGQLGTGDTVNRSSPTLLAGTTGTVIPTKILNYQSFSQVSTGISYTIAKRANDNVLMGWGINTSGQLGDNTATQARRSNPTLIGYRTFVDASENNITSVTFTGSPKNVDFSPFANQPYNTVTSGGSTQFSGLGDVINCGTNSVFAFGTGPFCIEFWCYNNILKAVAAVTTNPSVTSVTDSFIVGWDAAGSYNVVVGNTTFASSPGFIKTNVWQHIVCCRDSSNNVAVFIDGVRGSPGVVASNLVRTTLGIGDFPTTPSQNIDGYLSNVRLVKGSSVYDPTLSTLTVPTSPLTAIANTVLLTCQTFGTAYTGNISALGSTSVFGNSNSQLYVTGLAASGQLGDNTTINKSSSVQLGTGYVGLNTNYNTPTLISNQSWSSVSAGTSYSLALRNDNSLFAWGLNSSGQLGVSNAVARGFPTQITNNSSTFTDNSTNNFTITPNLYARMVNFTPFATVPYDTSVYGGSGSFISNDTYVSIASNAAFDLPGDFTIELWFYLNFPPVANSVMLLDRWVTGVAGSYQLYYRGTGRSITFLVDSATVLLQDPSPDTILPNVWYHVAVVRNGVGSNNVTLYINGLPKISATYTSSLTTSNTLYLGTQGSTLTADLDGYLSNVRIVKGVAVYTSSFVVPTSPLTAISGTSLLTCRDIGSTTIFNKFSAGAAHTLIRNSASTQVSAFGLTTSGQLGLGDTINRSSPVIVGSGTQINTYTNSPVLVTPGTSGYTQVFAGQSFSVVKRTDEVYVWGLNSSGQLGDNSIINKSSPTLLSAGTNLQIVDQSNSGFSILRNGTGYSTTVVPFAGAISGYFGGSPNGLQVVNANQLDFGVGDFCMECWIYPTLSYYPLSGVFMSHGQYNGSGYYIGMSCYQGNIRVAISNPNTTLTTTVGVTPFTANTWYHVAVIRNQSTVLPSTMNMYVNGTIIGSITNTNNYDSVANEGIGSAFAGSGARSPYYYFTGYISNVRIVKGNYVYGGNGAVGNFTPPTSPLAKTQSAGTNINAITGNETSLLIYNTPSSVTEVSEGFNLISAGYTHVTSVSSNNKLYAWGLNSSGQFGTGNAVTYSSPVLVGNSQIINTGTLSPVQVNFGLPNSWASVAAGQSFSMVRAFDGSVYVWGLNSSGQLGQSDSINRSKPTLVGGQLNAVLDVSSAANTITKYGTTYTTTTVPTAGSVAGYFNGVSDYLRCDAALSGLTTTTAQFTIEGYGNPSTYSGFANGRFMIGINSKSSGTNNLLIGVDRIYYNGTEISSLSLPLNTWTHFAATFDGTTFRYFIGGVESYSEVAAPQTAFSNNVFLIGTEADAADGGTLGNYLQGYLSNIRVTPQALYTGTFTPPTGILTTSSVGTSGPNVAASLSGTVSFLTYTTAAATIDGAQPFYQSSIAAGATHSTTVNDFNILYAWGAGGSGQLGTNAINNLSSPVVVGGQTNADFRSPILAASGSWSSASAGASHSLAIKVDNTLYGWGLNNAGQLGLNNTIDRSSVTQIDTTDAYASVSAGSSTSMVIKLNNLLYATGLGTSGVLGTNTAINRSSFVQVGSNSWTLVSTGLTTSMGIDSNNLLYSWGATTLGQLGLSTTTPARSNPTLVQGINHQTKSPTLVAGSWNAINAGLSHTAALRNAQLYTWGLATSGQIGNNSVTNRSSPVLIGAGLVTIVDISSFSRTISTSGSPYSQNIVIPFANTSSTSFDGSSDNAFFALTSSYWDADFTIEFFIKTTDTKSPAVIFSNWFDSSFLGGSFSLSIFLGQVRVSHYQSSGTNQTQFISTATSVNDNNWHHVAFTQVQGISTKTFRIFIDGILSAYNVQTTWTQGSSNPNSYIASQNPGTFGVASRYFNGYLSNFRLVTSVVYSTSSTTIGATIFTPPSNALTNISGTQVLIMVQPVTGSGGYSSTFAGSATTYAIRDDGNLYAWGLGTTGQISGYEQAINRSNPNQIGNNYLSVNQSSPVLIASGSWSKIGAGASVSAAIRSDGLLFTWGLNTSGQMGDNTVIAKSSPVQIGNSSWAQVSVIDNHMIALDTASSAYTWGLNASGQLGDGTTINKSNPVLLGSFTTIAAGSSFTGGITNTGALFMWGVGALGVLGNSATINRSSPIQIGTSSWTAIAAGASVASAIRSDGSIFNWGAGTLGQLGQAYSIISRSSPIQLGNEYAVANVYIPTKIDGELGTTSWSSVSAGNSYSAGISNNNSLFLWGLNNAGQIGLNDTINRSSPTQVTGTYSEVSAGNSFTGARAIIYPTSQ